MRIKTTNQQVLEWSEMVGGAFRFLESRGYVRQVPQLSVVWGAVTYLGPKLGVRLAVEIDGFFMFVALFRKGYPDYDDTLYLQECLERLGLPRGEETELISMRGDFSNCSRMLEMLAATLEKNLDSIESEVDRLFPVSGA